MPHGLVAVDVAFALEESVRMVELEELEAGTQLVAGSHEMAVEG